MGATREPRLFTDVENTTRALGAADYRYPDFAVLWLRSIGLEADAVRSVSVERPYAVPDTDGVQRRADVYLEVEHPRSHEEGGHEGETNSVVDDVFIEAKVDVLVDDKQLEHAGRVADRVVCLLPDELPGPTEAEVTVATWEDLVSRMEGERNDLLPFLAHRFETSVFHHFPQVGHLGGQLAVSGHIGL